MPLPRRICSVKTMQKVIRMLRHEGRPVAQAVAIAYDRLKQSCLTPLQLKRLGDKRLTPKQIVAMKRRKNPFPLLIATLGNPPADIKSFSGYRSGLIKFRQSHGSKAEMIPIVADIPGVEKGTTWVLQGVEQSVVYRSDIVSGTSKGKEPYEHNVGAGAKINVLKYRYYSADYPGIELIVTINADTGNIINSYKKGWMDES